MRILITGGAGFIGTRLLSTLRDEHDIWIYDSFLDQVHEGNDYLKGQTKGATVIRGDVRDRDSVHGTIKKANPELVYHFAADTGTGQSFDEIGRYNDVNVMGTSHLIEGVRAYGENVRRIVLAGSRSVYGEGACVDDRGHPTIAVARADTALAAGDFAPKCPQGRPLTPVATNADCPVQPASIYASTKLMQEYLLKQAFWGSDVEIGILRLQNVYGPGQSLNNPYTGVISIFTRLIQDGKRLNIYEDGEITRDFVFVDDVAAAFNAIGTGETCPTDILDIGSGEATTILGMAKSLLTKLGEPADKLDISGDFRAGDIRYALADISRAKKQLGWAPTVMIDEGLDRFLAWARH